ncbi:hypothetical protein ACHWQZ_G004410 [Mnemiopsis leidyi]
MKLISWLTILLVTTVQSNEILQIYREQYEKVIWDTAKNLISSVITEDGETFKPAVKHALDVIEYQVCEEDGSQGDDCDPFKNWILGCPCRDQFAALTGNCKNIPCKLVKLLKSDGADLLSKMVSAKNYEQRQRVLMRLLKPISRNLCECRGTVGAGINCVRDYKSSILKMANIDTDRFDHVVKHLDWVTVGDILHGFLGAVCDSYKGDDCLNSLGWFQINGGAFIDNSLQTSDTCLSLVRVQQDIEDFFKSQVYDRHEADVAVYFNGIVDAHVKMQEKLFCDSECAGEMQKSFYFSCCIKRAGEIMSSDEMKEKYVQLFENIWGLYESGETPDIRGAVEKALSLFRPDSFCGGSTDVYLNMDQKCEKKRN